MKRKKLFISIFPILLSAISLPLFISCSAEGNQQSSISNNNNNNNSNSNINNDYPNHNDNSNNQKEKDEKSVPDIVNEVKTKYYVEENSNKLFFRGAITNSNSDLSNPDINNVKNVLFHNGIWLSQTSNNATIYEAENFNDIELFKKFLNYSSFTNENKSNEINLDINDINYNSIGNPNNIRGLFEIVETKLDDKTQREISLVIKLANDKTWKSNSENYSIIFTYVLTIFSGS